jgi:hypothetical protein
MGNHFFDYQNFAQAYSNSAGQATGGQLSDFGILGKLIPLTLNSSPHWILNGQGQTDKLSGQSIYGQPYSYFNPLDPTVAASNVSVTNALYGALTNATLEQRQNSTSELFLALGHVLHHVQDMAQPQHVRNDNHCNPEAPDLELPSPIPAPPIPLNDLVCALIGNSFLAGYLPSAYEAYVLDHTYHGEYIKDVPPHTSLPVVNGGLALSDPRNWWYPPYAGAVDYGIAAYTSTNFFSAGTNLSYSGGKGIASSKEPVPAREDLTPAFQVASIADITQYYSRTIHDNLPDKPESADTQHLATAQSALGSIFSFVPGTAAFKLTDSIYQDQMQALVPKAVTYSEWFTDLLFNGAGALSATISGGYLFITNNSNYLLNYRDPNQQYSYATPFGLFADDGAGNRTGYSLYGTCAPTIYPKQTASCPLAEFYVDGKSNPAGFNWLPAGPGPSSYLLIYPGAPLMFTRVSAPACTVPGCLVAFTVKEDYTLNCPASLGGSSSETDYSFFYMYETPAKPGQFTLMSQFVLHMGLDESNLLLRPATSSAPLQLPATLTVEYGGSLETAYRPVASGQATVDSNGLSGSVTFSDDACSDSVVLSSTAFKQYTQGEPIPVIQ